MTFDYYPIQKFLHDYVLATSATKENGEENWEEVTDVLERIRCYRCYGIACGCYWNQIKNIVYFRYGVTGSIVGMENNNPSIVVAVIATNDLKSSCYGSLEI